jgi:hypothetical protein
MYQRSVLPSQSSIQRVSYELHGIGQKVILFHHKEPPFSEVYQCDFCKIHQKHLDCMKERKFNLLSFALHLLELSCVMVCVIWQLILK